jgi:acetyl-CoA carboxylase biotin carboxyl carrier protein
MEHGVKMSKPPSLKETIVRQLAEILKETDLTEIEYEVEGCRIRVARQQTYAPVTSVAFPPATMHASAPALTESAQAVAPAPVMDLASNPGSIKSPMVGTVYRSPTPSANTFVEVGSAVKKDQTVLIIEAMKVMNQIRAHKDGVVSQILCRDAEPVEYGQVLMVID